MRSSADQSTKTIPRDTSSRTEEEKQHRTLTEAERAHILKVLDSTRWRVSGPNGAAQILGINPQTLVSRMKKLGIQRMPSNEF